MTVNGHPILGRSTLPLVLLIRPPTATPLPINTGRTACLLEKTPFSAEMEVLCNGYVTVMTVNGHPILVRSTLPLVLLVRPPRATPLPINTGRTACLLEKTPFSAEIEVLCNGYDR